MSIELGYLFAREVEGKPTVYQGEIRFQKYSDAIYLIPQPKKSDKSPDFAVKLKVGDDYEERGGAWRRPLKAGGFMLSVAIDGPEFAEPLNAAAFPDDNQPKDTPKNAPVNFTIRWSRIKPRDGAPTASGAKPSLEDEIPY